MRVRVATRSDNRDQTLRRHAKKAVRVARGHHSVFGHLYVTARAVLEANGHGHARGEFTMQLRFSRTSTDGTPADEVGSVLRADGVEEFTTAGHTHPIDLQ